MFSIQSVKIGIDYSGILLVSTAELQALLGCGGVRDLALLQHSPTLEFFPIPIALPLILNSLLVSFFLLLIQHVIERHQGADKCDDGGQKSNYCTPMGSFFFVDVTCLFQRMRPMKKTFLRLLQQ
jgi:hypothetical protein